jgi:hypothetical protein
MCSLDSLVDQRKYLYLDQCVNNNFKMVLLKEELCI